MDLWLHVNGEDYPIVPGCTLTDNMGEELDSMQIRVPHVPNIRMKPYDDAYVHDGWYTGRTYGRICKIPEGRFYRHFLIFNYDRTEVNQLDNVYNYSITLVSETKYLEKVLMPNRTITIPFEKPGRSVLEMSEIFTERYTPKIKYSGGDGVWEWKDRFLVSNSKKVVFDDDDKAELARRNLEIVSDVFSDVQAMETSFNNPTLREALTKIFSVSNCIPVVFDGIIFARDISKKRNKFAEITGKVWDTSTMSGDQYVDRLRKNYSSGLTDKNGCVFHEYVGFRNMNVSSMRYSDLQIEVKHPIYRINKLLVCSYYKPDGRVKKLDITSFVIPSSTRAFLSNDYIAYQNHPPKTINGYLDFNNTYVLGACDYKFMTIQYDIGSTSISGFGDMVKYTTNGVDFIQRTVFENILSMSISETVGEFEFEEDVKTDDDVVDMVVDRETSYSLGRIMAKKVPSSIQGFWNELMENVSSIFGIGERGVVSADSMKMKSVFFEIEYQGMISSSVMVSKDMHDGDIIATDNQQESLAVMEQDGITSKYKVNRLGNETSSVTARVLGFDDLVDIGDYDVNHGICYKRTISLEKDFISVNYTFAKEYVITNYFTGVFSKYRSSAYASPSQSVERNEVANVQMLLSTKVSLRNPHDGALFSYEIGIEPFLTIFGIDSPSFNSIAYYDVIAPEQGEVAYDVYKNLELQYFVADKAYYMSGCSLCCTFGMTDSETAGTYIKQVFPEVTEITKNSLQVGNDYDTGKYGPYIFYSFENSPINDITGSAQDFLSLPISRSDGKVENMEFCIKFSSDGLWDDFFEINEEHSEEEIDKLYENRILRLPKINKDDAQILETLEGVSIKEAYKDAKEVISETFQVEPISTENGIKFSPYFLKLSKLYPVKKNIVLVAEENEGFGELLCNTDNRRSYYRMAGSIMPFGMITHSLCFYTRIGDFSLKEFSKLKEKDIQLNRTFEYRSERAPQGNPLNFVGTLRVNLYRIAEVNSQNIKVEMSMEFIFDTPWKKDDTFFFYGCKRIYTDVFLATWWDADYLKDSYKKELEAPLENQEENQKFFASKVIVEDSSFNRIIKDMSVWDYIYTDNFISLRQNCFFASPGNRRCFSFNFDSFPYNSNIHLVDENDVESTMDTGDTYGYRYSDYGTLYYGVHSDEYKRNFITSIPELCEGTTYYRNNWRGALSETVPVGAYVGRQDESQGPEKTGIDRLQEELEEVWSEPNSFWYLKSGEINEEFDVNKTYEQGSLENLGFIKAKSTRPDGKFATLSNEKIRISMNPASQSELNFGSAYMFYLDDDGMLHFVFGCNVDKVGQVYAALIYVSLVYDRSRTVFNADMEPVLMTANYAKVSSDADNICVDKNDANL